MNKLNILTLSSSSLPDVPSNLINVAYGRPAFQSSTWANCRAPNAVDGKRNGKVEDNSCAQTRKETDPWWGVDLGKSVWVENVLIANRKDSQHKKLSNVDIRIGKTSNHCFIMLCDVWFIHVPQNSKACSDGS